MRPIATDGVAWLVCPSVGHVRDPCKTAEAIEMPLGGADLYGSMESCIRWGSRSPTDFGGCSSH